MLHIDGSVRPQCFILIRQYITEAPSKSRPTPSSFYLLNSSNHTIVRVFAESCLTGLNISRGSKSRTELFVAGDVQLVRSNIVIQKATGLSVSTVVTPVFCEQSH